MLAGKPVLQHVVDAVKASGLPFHVEAAGHPGMGDSIAAAVRATQNANGWLILPGDLPFLQSATLSHLAACMGQASTGADVFIPVFNGQRGHPVGFSRRCLADLLSLQGNQGAVPVVRSYTAIEIVVNDVGVVTDIDTVEDLERAQALFNAAPPAGG